MFLKIFREKRFRKKELSDKEKCILNKLPDTIKIG